MLLSLRCDTLWFSTVSKPLTMPLSLWLRYNGHTFFTWTGPPSLRLTGLTPPTDRCWKDWWALRTLAPWLTFPHLFLLSSTEALFKESSLVHHCLDRELQHLRSRHHWHTSFPCSGHFTLTQLCGHASHNLFSPLPAERKFCSIWSKMSRLGNSCYPPPCQTPEHNNAHPIHFIYFI